ncbi:transposase family protein [Ktedonosporobacter rubrisoli]|uniref:Transposase family protein n=1 Tax=Ktedonosporobacter rubrisoli TaxID=2509675 RepID=A0A4P6JPE0_KTERU|nr:transposase family protein [Ktedonosporobacter rubrisoli]QBD77249.1 transposase family protein [Ktedonosporobacter rubrisoli]
MMLEVSSLLSLPAGLEIAEITETSDLVIVHVVTTSPIKAYPLCSEFATHVCSYYTRKVSDLQWAGQHVQLLFHVRKFRCDTATCPRKVFAEHLDSFVEAWARQTKRSHEAIEAIGLSTCGKGEHDWLTVWV